MDGSRKTVLHDRHLALGAKMVDFAGWHMPMQYPGGIIREHLATRREAGLFDVSHMGRFAFRGSDAQAFLQYALTCDVSATPAGQATYTFVPDSAGGAVDDALLYHFRDAESLLVVNAANRQKDWDHFRTLAAGAGAEGFGNPEMIDRSAELAMLSLQGPRSEEILLGLLEAGQLPQPRRNALAKLTLATAEVDVGRTGYTGEPVCFELFCPAADAGRIWDLLIQRGAAPVGLGARDTLRLEAALPLYGHELGLDADGQPIPIFACPQARFGVSFSETKGDFIGREALTRQHEARRAGAAGDPSGRAALPRRVMPVALTAPGVARAGANVFRGGRQIGYVTSGTAVPYWKTRGEGPRIGPADEHTIRSIALALLDSDLTVGQQIEIQIRGRRTAAVVVRRHLRSDQPPYAQAVLPDATDPPRAQGRPRP